MKKYIYLIQCAWILWGASQGAEFPFGGYDSRDDCQKEIGVRQAIVTRQKAKGESKYDWAFVCLPDTVDPREPRKR
jgi:hypothetical protein